MAEISIAGSAEIDNFKKVIVYMKEDTAKAKAILSLGASLRDADPGASIEAFLQAASLSKKINYEYGVMKSLWSLSYIYWFKGDYQKAMSNGFDALKIAEKRKDEKAQEGILDNLGLAFTSHGDYGKALGFYTSALQLTAKRQDSSYMSAIMNNMANVFFYQGIYRKALFYHQSALDIRQKLGQKNGVADCYNDMALVYDAEKDFAKAEEYFSKCLVLKEQLNDSEGIAFSCGNLASVYRELHEYKKAIGFSSRVEKICLNKGFKPILSECYNNLSIVYRETGDYKNAYQSFSKYAALKDSIVNETNNRQIAEMQTIYETEKKGAQIKELETDKLIKQLDLDKKDSDIAKRDQFIWFACFGILIVMLLAFFIYKAYAQKKRTNLELQSAYTIIEDKNVLVEEKNKEILDSIHYAKRIQAALLSSGSLLKKNIPKHFIFYKPKDIVSGDFYWVAEVEKENKKQIMICAGDCTGHGVPGAFMSLLCISCLNELSGGKKISQPDLIFHELRDNIIKTLNPEGTEESKDGMDGVVCNFDLAKRDLSFACANNPLWIIKGNEPAKILEYKADKFPVGKHFNDELLPFTLQNIHLEKGDVIYLFTDGYADQFGGPHGKKFKYKQLQELIVKINNRSMEDQKTLLEKTIMDWKGNVEQVDDILIIGIRV